MRPVAIFTAAAIILAAAPAFAAGPDRPDTGQVTVRLGDLDLNTAPGAHTAITRLARAAAEACGDQPGVSPDLIRLSDTYQRCRSATLEAAVVRINTAAVDVAFAEAHGRAVRLARR
jgi:UrcA family protein